MNKKIMFLPLLALVGSALASCGHEHTFSSDWESNESFHWHPATCEHKDEIANKGAHNDGDGDDYCDVCNRYIGPDMSKLGPDEFLGHKRATELEEGKDYYLGIYKKNYDEMWFINGEPHKDKNGEYPYYMSETQVVKEADFADVATVQIEYTNDEHTKFTIQIFKAGAQNDYKYISVYKAESSYENYVMSIHCATEPGESYINPVTGDEYETFYEFEWLDEYNYTFVKTAVIMVQDERLEEEEPAPKFLGTDDEFVSMDCGQSDKIGIDTYNLGYFYEVE